jgi:hypothetical protein
MKAPPLLAHGSKNGVIGTVMTIAGPAIVPAVAGITRGMVKQRVFGLDAGMIAAIRRAWSQRRSSSLEA